MIIVGSPYHQEQYTPFGVEILRQSVILLWRGRLLIIPSNPVHGGVAGFQEVSQNCPSRLAHAWYAGALELPLFSGNCPWFHPIAFRQRGKQLPGTSLQGNETFQPLARRQTGSVLRRVTIFSRVVHIHYDARHGHDRQPSFLHRVIPARETTTCRRVGEHAEAE